MLRCLIWGCSKIFFSHISALRLFELKNEIRITGITGNETLYNSILDIPFIPKTGIDKNDYDCVVVMSDRKADIEEEAIKIGFPKSIIVGYKALENCDFSFKKILSLKQKMPSIIANNCWGGFTYNSIGEEFTSPLINLFVEENDYLKLLSNPQKYLSEPLKFERMEYSVFLRTEYPLCKCDDIYIHCNHYKDFEQARECWDRRKRRIDWDNLFVFFYTNNLNSARIFENFEYEKKICFTSFDTSIHKELKSSITVPFYNQGRFKDRELWECVIAIAKQEIYLYDVMELLSSGNFNM